MGYRLASEEHAKHQAAHLNATVACALRGAIEYRTGLYPDGQTDRANWQWGVTRHELNYGKNGEERCTGFVWF